MLKWLFLLILIGLPSLMQGQGVTSRKEVRGSMWFCASRNDCRAWRPFARISDDPTGEPIYWLTAIDGTACEVSGMVQAKIRAGDSWECKWRTPR